MSFGISARSFLVPLAGLSFAAMASAQTALQREVAFVKDLAADLGFVSLALQEVENLKRDYRQSDDFKLVAQLGIEISLRGAKLQTNREQRRTLYKEAIDKSSEFISRYDGDPIAAEARANLVDACNEYGRFLIEEIELATADEPEKVKDLEQSASEVFQRGVEGCKKIRASLREDISTDQDKWLRYHVSWMLQGILQREQARAVQADRSTLCGISRRTLEDLIFEVGEGTVLGQRAYFEYAQNDEVEGNLKDAFQSYTDVSDSIKSILDEAEAVRLPEAAQNILYQMLQEVYDRLTQVSLKLGKSDAVLEAADRFRIDLAKYGQGKSDPENVTLDDVFDVAHSFYGHPVFLTEARALAESGDAAKIDRALEIAQRISDAHENDFIGLRAKTVLKEIMSVRADAVSGRVLFDIAEGEFSSRNWEKAIQNYKRALATMTAEEAPKFGLEAHRKLSRAFGIQKRFFESVLTCVIGLETYGATSEEATTSATADTLQTGWSNLSRSIRSELSDSTLSQLNSRVEAMLSRFGGDDNIAKVAYRNAKALYQERQFAKAAQAFAEVPADTVYHDQARSLRVSALVYAKDFAGARRAIEEFRAHLKTPAAEISSRRTDLLSYRRKALARITFYEQHMLYKESTQEQSYDRTKFPAIIEAVEAFINEYENDSPDLAPSAYDMAARLYIELGQLDKAEAKYNALRAAYRGNRAIAPLATEIFTAHSDNVKALTTEFEALRLQKGASRRAVDEVATRLKNAQRAALNSGQDYAKTSTAPQFGVLYNSVRIALELQDWNACIALGKQTIEGFADDKARAKTLNYVRRWVGQAYMGKPEPNWTAALELFRTVEKNDPKDFKVKRLIARALGGWMEFDGRTGNRRIIEGAGKPDEAYSKYYVEYRPYGLTRHAVYSLEWYRFHWEAYFFAKRAARSLGGKYERYADTLFSKAEAGDDFQKLLEYGQEGEELKRFFELFR